jgi:hypothetical protein
LWIVVCSGLTYIAGKLSFRAVWYRNSAWGFYWPPLATIGLSYLLLYWIVLRPELGMH